MKTSELEGPALAWAVAEAEGTFDFGVYTGFRVLEGKLHFLSSSGDVYHHPYEPHESWAQGGLIIGRVIHAFDHMQSDRVCAMIKRKDMCNGGWNYGYGPTPLIAAMRCFVASKLGNEIELPEEFK